MALTAAAAVLLVIAGMPSDESNPEDVRIFDGQLPGSDVFRDYSGTVICNLQTGFPMVLEGGLFSNMGTGDMLVVNVIVDGAVYYSWKFSGSDNLSPNYGGQDIDL
ncbi:hypothetical protein TALC_01010 [Thermoplasmatales archaeon BRNA1]|nr:hypothetical protein TALC_01010 [Thermoplasmatales archaeon BRNA1]